MIFAACTLYCCPGTICLCGAHDVISCATLESSWECSRCKSMVVLIGCQVRIWATTFMIEVLTLPKSCAPGITSHQDIHRWIYTLSWNLEDVVSNLPNKHRSCQLQVRPVELFVAIKEPCPNFESLQFCM